MKHNQTELWAIDWLTFWSCLTMACVWLVAGETMISVSFLIFAWLVVIVGALADRELLRRRL